MDDFYDNCATQADAEREWLFNVAEENSTHCWLLSDRDVWYRNPAYQGSEVPHPECD